MNGKELSVEELTTHVINNIRYERTRLIPDKPLMQLPKRKELPVLGTEAEEIAVMKEKNNSKSDNFENMRVT